MTMTEIAKIANELTDEDYATALILNFVNQAIARINTTLSAKLPLFTTSNTPYTAISQNWILMLFIPYAAYSIKINDGSLNEADRFKQEFESNFLLLEENKFKAIPEAFRDEYFGGIYQMDTSKGMNVGWFNKSKDGGF